MTRKLLDKTFSAQDFKSSSEELKNIREFVESAIEVDPWALMFAGEDLQSCRRMQQLAVEKISQQIKEQGEAAYWRQFKDPDDIEKRKDSYRRWHSM